MLTVLYTDPVYRVFSMRLLKFYLNPHKNTQRQRLLSSLFTGTETEAQRLSNLPKAHSWWTAI